MDHLAVEPPGGAIVAKSNVLAISGQDVCGDLEVREVRTGEGRRGECSWGQQKWTVKDGVTHGSGSARKHLPLLQQHLLGVKVVVDHDDPVGAHHQGVGGSVLALQRFEEHMRRVGAPQAEHAANQGQ